MAFIIRNKSILITTIILIFFGFIYLVFIERTWIKGATLNPYQIDEVELIKYDDPLYDHHGIRIHDKKFIRKILGNIQQARFIQEIFPLDEDLTKGEKYTLLARQGQIIKLRAKIFSGTNKGFNEEAAMLVGDRYYYELPNSIKQLFLLKPMEISQEVKNADMWIKWGPNVVIQGQPFYRYYVGKKLNDIQFKEDFIINKMLPSPTIIPISQDPQSLLKNTTASIGPTGTIISKLNGIYFSKNQKESDNWDVLLPYGQCAYDLDMGSANEEVEFCSFYDTSYFIVRNSENGVLVLSAQDPVSPEGNLLRWDKDKRQFVSQSGSVTYSRTGKPNKVGYAPMQVFPSKVWKGIVFFSYY